MIGCDDDKDGDDILFGCEDDVCCCNCCCLSNDNVNPMPVVTFPLMDLIGATLVALLLFGS